MARTSASTCARPAHRLTGNVLLPLWRTGITPLRKRGGGQKRRRRGVSRRRSAPPRVRRGRLMAARRARRPPRLLFPLPPLFRRGVIPILHKGKRTFPVSLRAGLAQIDAEVRPIEQKKSEKQSQYNRQQCGGKNEDFSFHGMNTILFLVLSLLFVPVPHIALCSPSSSRMSTTSCQPIKRERKPFGFLPYSTKPTLSYRPTADMFSATTSSSNWTSQP